jgi:predicted Zn-dependent protease
MRDGRAPGGKPRPYTGGVRLLALSVLVAGAAVAREPDVPAPKGLFRRLPPAEPGEWLWVFPEEGQTFAEYRESLPVRATPDRPAIYLAPFLARPPADRDLLAGLAAVLGASFGREVRVLPPAPLPAATYVRARRQVSALALAPHLARTLPADALFVLAVTDRDIFVGDLDYAFGWGSMKLRVGVLSTARLGAEDDPALRRRRSLLLALHEAHHLLSLPHCTYYACLMNGALTLEEADRRPGILCPVCRAKVSWNLGSDPTGAVAEAFAQAGLAADARAARAVIDATGFEPSG